MPMHVEARTLGRAVNISLTYDGASPAMNDKVTVTGVKVEVERVPRYLFANACYATPVEFKVAGADDVPVSSVEVSFYADGETPKQFTKNRLIDGVDLTARTMVLNGDNANKPLGAAKGRGNHFESYLKSTEYRKVILKGKHVTENARFEVKIELESSAGLLSVVSRSCDLESMVSKKFHDKTVPAFDIREGADATHLIQTSMGAFYDVEGAGRVTLVRWNTFRPLKALWHAGSDVDAWRKRTVYFVSRPDSQYDDQQITDLAEWPGWTHRSWKRFRKNANLGTWAKGIVQCWGCPNYYEWSEYRYARPYWAEDPQWSEFWLPGDTMGDLHTPVHKDGAKHKSAFDECSFGGSEGQRKAVWDLNPSHVPHAVRNELTMRQPGRNRFRGEYVARKVGV
jgi:hypothetical protein